MDIWVKPLSARLHNADILEVEDSKVVPQMVIN